MIGPASVKNRLCHECWEMMRVRGISGRTAALRALGRTVCLIHARADVIGAPDLIWIVAEGTGEADIVGPYGTIVHERDVVDVVVPQGST